VWLALTPGPASLSAPRPASSSAWPAGTEALRREVRALIQADRLEDAEARLSGAGELPPDLLADLLELRLRLGDPRGAVLAGWGKEAVMLPLPAHLPAWSSPRGTVLLAWALWLLGYAEEAAAFLEEKRPQLAPWEAASWLLTGLCRETRDQLPEAQTALARAESLFVRSGHALGASTAALHRLRLRLLSIPPERLPGRVLVRGARGALGREHLGLLAGWGLLLLRAGQARGVGQQTNATLTELLAHLEQLPPGIPWNPEVPPWLYPDPADLLRELVSEAAHRYDPFQEHAGGILPGDPHGQAAWEAWSWAWRLAELRRREAEARLGDAGGEPFPPVDPQRLFARLRAMDAVLLQYVVCERCTVALVSSPQGLAVEIFPWGRREVARLVSSLLESMTAPAGARADLTRLDLDRTLLNEAYDTLFMPLEGYLGQEGPLLVVADPPMDRLPLECLLRRRVPSPPTGGPPRGPIFREWQDSAPLLTRYAIAYLPSPAVLLETPAAALGCGAPAVVLPTPRKIQASGLSSWERLSLGPRLASLALPPYVPELESLESLRPLLERAHPSLCPGSGRPRARILAWDTLNATGEPLSLIYYALPVLLRPAHPAASGLAAGKPAPPDAAQPAPIPGFPQPSIVTLRAWAGEGPVGSLVLLGSGAVAPIPAPTERTAPRGFPPHRDSSLQTLAVAAQHRGARAIGLALWPTGAAQLPLVSRFLEELSLAPQGASTPELVGAWTEARRGLFYAVERAGEPPHDVSLAHPFFWAGWLLCLLGP
jgi:hypothetical protein